MPTAPAPLGPDATWNSRRSGSRSKRAMDAASASKRRTVASTIDWRRRTSTSGWQRLATTPRRAASLMVSSAALMVGSVGSLEGGPIDQRPAVMRRLSILSRRVDACDVALADGGRLGDLGDVTLGVLALDLGDLGDLRDVSAGAIAVGLRDLGDVACRVVAFGLGDLVHLVRLGHLVYVSIGGVAVGLGRLRCMCALPLGVV